MKLTCSIEKGGCGQKFEVTPDLLVDYKYYVEHGTTGGCPNMACTRAVTPEELSKLITLVEKKQSARLAKAQADAPDPWPGFPLKAPIIPNKRRKNGALPGVSFKKIFETDLDRPPTPAEIARVQRFFADGLDDGTDCPCCTRRAKRQHRALGSGPARWLIELVYLSDSCQAIHTAEIIKGLKGNNVSGSDATSVLPLYGLIQAAPNPKAAVNPPPPHSTSHAKPRTSGYWVPTKLGRSFALDRVKVPERIVTCLGLPEAFEGELISIKEALGKKFNYDEVMGRKVATP